jgi:hypothetical protein
MTSTVLRFAVQDICDHAPSLHSGFTLFIPPAFERPIQDRELLSRIDSVEHLDRITHRPGS